MNKDKSTRFAILKAFQAQLALLQWQGEFTAQAQKLKTGFKYSQGSMENLAALANACRSPAVARARLFGWLVFMASCSGLPEVQLPKST